MTRTTRRLTIASIALALGLAGTAPAGADHDADLGGILDVTDVGRIVTEDLPVITGDLEGGVADVLAGGGGLLGGVLASDGLLGGLLGGLGAGRDPNLSIQPVPTVGGTQMLEGPRIVGGLLDGVLDLGSISDSLAGRL